MGNVFKPQDFRLKKLHPLNEPGVWLELQLNSCVDAHVLIFYHIFCNQLTSSTMSMPQWYKWLVDVEKMSDPTLGMCFDKINEILWRGLLNLDVATA